MTAATYGPFVISDITHYADKDDLEELLHLTFRPTAAQPYPWRIAADNSGDFRVWAPRAITQGEKNELYSKNEARRSEMVDILSLRRYRI